MKVFQLIFLGRSQKIYANTHFIQYVNTILDEPTFDVDHISGT